MYGMNEKNQNKTNEEENNEGKNHEFIEEEVELINEAEELSDEKSDENSFYSILQKKAENKINSYKQRRKEASISDGLEEIISGEKLTLIKAFVTSSGDITDAYSMIQKSYIGLLKKINKKASMKKKTEVDDKIIKKCAKRRLEELEKNAIEANEYAESVSKKAEFYENKQLDLKAEYFEELNFSRAFKELKEEYKQILEEMKVDLTEKIEKGENTKEIFIEEKAAKKRMKELDKDYKKALTNAKWIRKRLEIMTPQYILTTLYSETLTDQALRLEVIHDSYVNLYDDLSKARAMTLKKFSEWNDSMEKFLSDYNKGSEVSSNYIMRFFNFYKNSGNILNGESTLEKYNYLIEESYKELEKRLEVIRDELIS